MKWRILTLIFVFSLCYAGLVCHLYKLQIKDGLIFSIQAADQNKNAEFIKPNRGNIYFIDKDNKSIAVALNKDLPLIYAEPKEIENVNETAQKISSIVGKSEEYLKKSLSKPNDLYELLVYPASDEQVEQIKNLKLKGVYIKNQLSRFYPFEETAAHLLGFVGQNQNNENIEGRYGAEAYFNKFLTGKTGEIKGDFIIKAVDGSDIFLTIDPSIQSQAEQILSSLIKQYGATGGTVIVEEPKTGKILAMTNSPTFNPNKYWEFNLSSFLNPAVQAVYEPGSVFKILTMAAGIDSGKITPQTTYIDTGSVTFNGKTIQNFEFKVYGKQTMANVIEHSINTGAVFAERQIGDDIFYNYLKKFGVAELTGITLPAEVKGSLNNLIKGRDINYATASFGQGVSVTPLELINAISVIANGGELMKPYILADEQPQVIRRVISENTAKTVTEMMVSAVKVNIIADIPNYSVAAKTGTAYVPNFKTGGYTDDVINSYIGFAPASDPKFIVLIKMDKPAGAISAGRSIVPAFKEFTKFLLNYYQVPPDELNNQ